MNKIIKTILMMILFIVVTGCSGLDSNLERPKLKTSENEKSHEIQLLPFAKEVGFSLHTPTMDQLEAHTFVDIEGKLDEVDSVEWAHIWVTITSKKTVDKFDQDDFNYYIPIENGTFSKQMILHNGDGEYEVSIRVPSNKKSEDNMYYDVATFTVNNLDEEIQREVEYTAYGSKEGISLTQPVESLLGSEQSVFVEGSVSKNTKGDMVLVQVKKGDESEQLVLPLVEGSFSDHIPLYFGEGLHTIGVQIYNEEDGLYYDSAFFYAHNNFATEFSEVVKTQEYITRGITLHEPSTLQSKIYNKQAYHIAGEIDQAIPGAEDITYVIVTVIHLEDALESGYIIPVEDNKFDGLAYFRFGPGNYEVVISVPTIEQHDQSMFQYQGVAKINQEVVDVKDDRGLLPSRGIESDHPAIIEQAKQLSAGLSNDRDKAKAIYKFVSQHVAYDVKKAENDLFNIGDSALSTLDSGSGICQDYAFLATALLRSIDMESHYVHGDAGERHAWVEVKVDGNWLEMDPTWGAGYVQEGVFYFHYTEDYFDPDPAFLAETHTRDGIMY